MTRGWTFLTHHAGALLCIAADPGIRLRDLAVNVGVTERAAQRIVNDLVAEGYVSRTRVGNRNVYQLHPELPFRIPLMRHREIGALLALVGAGPATVAGAGAAGPPAAAAHR